MPHDPADIGRRPENLALTDAIDMRHAPGDGHRMAAILPHHALGGAGGARRVENIERMGRIDRHTLDRLRLCQRVRPVEVAPLLHRRDRLGPLQQDDALDPVGRHLQRLVHQHLVGNDLAALDPAGCRHQQGWRRIVDPFGEFRRGEPAEHHRMDRADPRAGQHRDHRLRHHRHIQDDPIALADALGDDHACRARDLVLQLGEGEGQPRVRHRAFVDQRQILAAPRRDMAVYRIMACVHQAARKPAFALAPGAHRRHLPLDRLRRVQPIGFAIVLTAHLCVQIGLRHDFLSHVGNNHAVKL